MVWSAPACGVNKGEFVSRRLPDAAEANNRS
jgi:hypothetical protein